ncbi:uncharacterized protein KQ657_003658 [Scheffersomyces spartinae]|uniref:Amine oxidase domain-containing protein n=1 Tax=Scheffersomyces spartinae TaxID=45513 RepID=A0A9P8AKH0_9ASCO|nr:uncharacterized protein KQ657_003658 [Scheffersomyces spartinae]KAG7195137.1 hypothetical protein KQ657_003658 [Scheffersomyces spartinae]
MTTINTKVAIIGAGCSGLKAANELLTLLDQRDVYVVEAQDRIGGRLFTDRTSSVHGLPYDLGAAWFHDCLDNAVLDYKLALGKFEVPRDGYFDEKDIVVYDRDGVVDLNGLNLNQILLDAEKFSEKYYYALLDHKDVPLKEIATRYIEKFDKLLTPQQKHYLVRMIRYLELWHGISWDVMSAKYGILQHEGRNLYNKEGFGRLPEELAKGVENILLSQPVKKIYRGGDKVRVVCQTGLTIEADYIIVTVPQSVLALDKDEVGGIEWIPSLPKNVTESLESIHFGALGKIVLEFDQVWWDYSQDRYTILPDYDAAPVPIEFTPENPPIPFQFPAYAINYSKVHDSPNKPSLVLLTQAPLTNYFEKYPEKAWEYYKPMLQKLSVTGNRPIPDPLQVLTTSWTQNPYFRGSYSAVHAGDDADGCIIQLSNEFPNVGLGLDSHVRFAGEHTILEGAGCVHGAWLSGMREAKFILKAFALKTSSKL